MKPFVLYVFLAAAVIAGGVYFFGNSAENARTKKEIIPVEVLRVYEDMIFDSVESLGTTRANESVDITPNITEAITQIDFTDGQTVKKGDLIALLSQKEERAQLAAAQARLKENRRELERLEILLKNRAAAQREYDERLTLIEVTKQEIEAIEARIADRTLRATFDGVLGIRRVSVGSLVQPGELITTLDDISRMKLDFAVPAIYMDSLEIGVPIEARRDGINDTVFQGEIASINSRIDPVTRSILVRAIVPNESGLLKPGLLMRVTLLRNARKALIVAEESVLQRQDKHFVLVVPQEGGAVEEREIQIGTRRPGSVEVTQGLTAGEYVITRGVNRVTDGQQASIAEVWETIRLPNPAVDAPAEEME